MYSHKLKKVKKTNLRNKRDVVNNTHGSYTKHYKNSKNTKNSLKTNLRSLHKNTNIKNAKMPKFKQHAVLHGGASGPSGPGQYDDKYIVNGDDNMKTFSTLPDTELIKVKTLTIRNWKGLTVLPKLKALTKLNIQNCDGLKELPDMFGSLQALTELKISYCENLRSLPKTIGDLKELKTLKINSCERLTTVLPENFGGLQALTKLFIYFCNSLTVLPDSICSLQALTILEINNCSLTILPKKFGSLQALKELIIDHCNGLTVLPESIGSLQALTKFKIYNCRNLTVLPENFGGLQALKEFTITYCDSLKELPVDFGSLQALKTLDIIHCKRLTVLPESIGGLQALKELGIYDCNGLTSLPESIGLCFNLESINITKVMLLPPSVILLMPYIEVNSKTPDNMQVKNWLDVIKSSTNPFYTKTTIDTLLGGSFENRYKKGLIDKDTNKSVVNLFLGMLRIEKQKKIAERADVLNLTTEKIKELSKLSYEDLYLKDVLERPQPGSLNTTATQPITHLNALDMIDKVEKSESSTHRFLLAHKSLTIQELLNKYGERYSDEVVRAEALYDDNLDIDNTTESKFITDASTFAHNTRANNRAPGDRVDNMEMVKLPPRINYTGAHGANGANGARVE